jgi:hypothetical protein
MDEYFGVIPSNRQWEGEEPPKKHKYIHTQQTIYPKTQAYIYPANNNQTQMIENGELYPWHLGCSEDEWTAVSTLTLLLLPPQFASSLHCIPPPPSALLGATISNRLSHISTK